MLDVLINAHSMSCVYMDCSTSDTIMIIKTG